MKILEYGNNTAQIVLIQMIAEHDLKIMESEIDYIHERTDEDFLFRAFQVENWNDDLSPWKAPAVFGKENFGGGAEKTLKEVLKSCGDRNKTYYIGGYSLAGLFSLWSAYQTDVFSGVAAASPSIWFPGFTEYMSEHKTFCDHVYLSLGDKEANTRNPVMASVAQKIRVANELLQEQNINTILEWNEGNHFRDYDLRTAKAFAWICRC